MREYASGHVRQGSLQASAQAIVGYSWSHVVSHNRLALLRPIELQLDAVQS